MHTQINRMRITIDFHFVIGLRAGQGGDPFNRGTTRIFKDEFSDAREIRQCEFFHHLDQSTMPDLITGRERKDIAELHHKFKDKPYQANRTLGVLSKMFNLSEIWGLRPDGSNPCTKFCAEVSSRNV